MLVCLCSALMSSTIYSFIFLFSWFLHVCAAIKQRWLHDDSFFAIVGVFFQFPVFPWLFKSIFSAHFYSNRFGFCAHKAIPDKCAFAKANPYTYFITFELIIWNVKRKLLLFQRKMPPGKRNYDFELRSTQSIKRKIAAFFIPSLFLLVGNFINFFTM